MKRLFIWGILILVFSTNTFSEKIKGYSEKHMEIVLRDIGHQLLLHAKDSTSRVMPIRNINQNTFQIEFQSQFTFVADTLIALVDKRIKATNLPDEYIVSVLNCGDKIFIFGYEVSQKNGNIMPCSGRIQPKGCYILQIEFLEKPPTKYSPLLWLLIPFAFISFIIKQQYFDKRKIIQLTDNQLFLKLGSGIFYPESLIIKTDKDQIVLSEKEAKLLKILIENTNQTTERDKFMKELWEDEGVIVVGRSLDVMISKLRKKLEFDETIKIANVHGKGYKLTLTQV